MNSPTGSGKSNKNTSNQNAQAQKNNASSLNSAAVAPEAVPQIVERAGLWAAFSGTLILVSLIAIYLSFAKFGSPVKLGLDFTGGSQIEYSFAAANKELTPVNIKEKVLSKINEQVSAEAIVQVSQDKALILRSKELNLEDREKLDKLLSKEFGKFEILSVDTVSGSIGPELLSSGLIALGITLAGILVFVTYRFRRDFALCAILALCHDVLIVVGLFAILGLVKGVEVNILFLTACLTVLGFSIHDTIVVFDRIRENTKYLSKKKNLVSIINDSIAQVWFRSICTSLTTMITLGTLFLFGGESTKIFAGAMFAGILTGSYSSIFVASVALGQWNKRQEQKKVKAA